MLLITEYTIVLKKIEVSLLLNKFS